MYAYFHHIKPLCVLSDHAQEGSHIGRCDDDVKRLSQKPYIAKQLAAIEPEALKRELREVGAWLYDEGELDDHAQNLQRILWIACSEIVSEMWERSIKRNR